MSDRNKNWQNGRVSTHPDVKRGSANRQTSFSGRGNVYFLFQDTLSTISKTHYFPAEQRRPHCKKMDVLYYLALQFEALVILLQDIHCTNVEKLVHLGYQLAGSFLSRKHGLATFVHEQLRYTLLDQSPSTSEVEWFSVDVDGQRKTTTITKFPSAFSSLSLYWRLQLSPR